MRRLADRLDHVPWQVVLLLGTGLSVLSLGYSYTYCLDGAAQGLPFPVLRPSHEGSSLMTIFVGEIRRVPSEIFVPGVLANLATWSALAVAALAVAPRRLIETARVRIDWPR